jgi:hypothetical protein
MRARALLQLEAFGTGRDKVLACGTPADRKATFLDLVGGWPTIANGMTKVLNLVVDTNDAFAGAARVVAVCVLMSQTPGYC